ncbi:type II toxin-antitoxin system Phd/YefM family antitoxin [Acinetobacter bereziniae]|mgnify:FL=1|jgi:antitoxin StbD|uniref:Type II toxin-antitoxin system Phd/YefM family antitoxin n=2 Tax=Acinetobacter TaxID=469 RepID=A0AA42MCA6_ACIJO|nr:MULTISPECIES: type II toxin-antitoxin system Phd/YefM family antitoxin [Acinetobacter]KEC83103.1 antitoxin [Acinetobacter sp. ETR1]MBJ9905371.1 type II toxin-antitoxin system Phd/YefM family antitoxin [Acinetobacter bereziniae]MCG7223065.1 type II toxin-antitoxin system Phd/YefM family antitoxin [Acinetobacter sp. AG3]MCH2006827.1 type II toxin-antitoxin system Phd/YefM family antitoxin [Acinetobacter ursingii]MCU4328107.1 type II toxin-antitoxin system Phd/YefM family antitoxin [Acinetobac
MNNIILSRFVSSVSELKKNPMEVVQNGFGEAVAILNRNNPAFYCVPADMYERMMDLIEDQELLKLVEQVDTDKTVKVSIDELRTRVRGKSA